MKFVDSDYSGLIVFMKKQKPADKAYISLFPCTLSKETASW